MQRWLASVLLHCEQSFRRVKGYESITQVVANIKKEHEKNTIPAVIENAA
jgi:hypothetical protein